MKLNRQVVYALFLLLVPLGATSRDKSTEQDKAVAQELITDSNQLKRITQSHSHLNIKFVQDKIRETSELARHKDLIDRALSREAEMAKRGYAVFYTAVPYMRLFQDITRKQYQKVVGYVGALQEKAFQFIRYTYKNPDYAQYKNVTDFLVQDLRKNGIVDDNQIDKRTILVSANISFFGNISSVGESTYHYFNNPQPWVSLNELFLRQSLRSFGYSEEFVPELMALAQSIITGTGDLFQIFIPNNLVNEIGYLSWRYGIPFDVEFINYLFGNKTIVIHDENGEIKKEFFRGKMTFGHGDFLHVAELSERVTDYRTRYAQKDPETIKRTNGLISNALAGKYHLLPFLDNYKNGRMPYTNFYQARLLITLQYLLNPESGLKIYRYSSLDEARENQYKTKLKDIFDRMEKDRVRGLGGVHEA